MIANLLEKRKLKQEIRKAYWEKELMKALCPHDIVPLEKYREWYDSGYEVDSRDVYSAYCPLCDKTFYYDDKVHLSNALEKQRARNESGVMQV